MAPSIIFGVVSVIGSALSYSASKKSAKAEEEMARQQEEKAKREREQAIAQANLEQQQKQAQLAHDVAIAKSNTEFRIGLAEEDAKIADDREKRLHDELYAAQIVGFASSGVSTVLGSPLAVMEKSKKYSNMIRGDINREFTRYKVSAERDLADAVNTGNFDLENFMASTELFKAQTIENKSAEISAARKKATSARGQASMAKYGMIAGLAGSAAKLYSMSNMTTKEKWGMLT